MNGPYSFTVRPAIASDGTVYSVDAFFHLYAIAPDGGLKWLVRGAGNKGVAVGQDGSIYVASERFHQGVQSGRLCQVDVRSRTRARSSAWVSRWDLMEIFIPSGTEGPGVCFLTPAGALRWQQPETYARPIVDYGEIVLGPNSSSQQLYFYANNHLRAMGLDGSSVFTNSSGQISQLKPGLQPVVAPDGSVHAVIWAYSPSGSLLWSFETPFPYNTFTAADIGSDGTHYFGQDLSQLFALNTNGSERWRATLNAYVGGPIVDPLNTQLVMGSNETGDHAGFILASSAQDGHELWRVILPIEDPTIWNPYLGIRVQSIRRYASDIHSRRATAYILTSTATGDNNTSKSFVTLLPPATEPGETNERGLAQNSWHGRSLRH